MISKINYHIIMSSGNVGTAEDQANQQVNEPNPEDKRPEPPKTLNDWEIDQLIRDDLGYDPDNLYKDNE